jgi:hypothetical protein
MNPPDATASIAARTTFRDDRETSLRGRDDGKIVLIYGNVNSKFRKRHLQHVSADQLSGIVREIDFVKRV